VEAHFADVEKGMQAAKERGDAALNELHAALDPAQRKAVVAAVRAKQAKMAEHVRPEGKEGREDKAGKGKDGYGKWKLEKMTKNLDLDAAQQKTVDGILAKHADKEPQDREHMREEMKKRMDALLTAFEGDAFDAKKLDASFPAGGKMRDSMKEHVKVLAELVPVLKPEQREKLVATMDRGMKGRRGMMGHGGHPVPLPFEDPAPIEPAE
jgi:Spy/CpxP family protein refolding chaperone